MKYKLDQKKFEAFAYYHLTHHMQYPVSDFHKELISALAHPRIAIAAPRGHSKSTWCSFFYPLFMALEHPGIKIIIVSATASLSEVILAKIKKEIETNLTIREFYGDQEGSRKWTGSHLELANESEIVAMGTGGQIRGRRPDVVIGDDLEDDETVLSADRRKKFDNWFWNEAVGTFKGAEGQFVVVGTILHPESFLAEIINQGRFGWKTRFYQAIKKDGTSLWPDMWPIGVLHARKMELGEYGFNQEYMNDPIPDDKRVFQRQWVKYFEREPEGCVYFTTIDPAISTDRDSDCTAIVTCAVDNKENLWVVDVVNDRLLPNEVVDKVFELYRKYKSSVIGIETVAAQKLFKYEIDREKKRRNEYPIVRELKTGGRRKGLRIEALQPLFENGKIMIKEKHTELVTQLLSYPSTRCHDDIIDALAYQLDIIRPAKGQVTHVNPNSFLAVLERRRKRHKNQTGGYWGNQYVRRDSGAIK